jgi:hypothetical protein
MLRSDRAARNLSWCQLFYLHLADLPVTIGRIRMEGLADDYVAPRLVAIGSARLDWLAYRAECVGCGW